MPVPGTRIMTGIAGEHFVAGELSKRGWIVGLTAKNTAQVDLLAKRPGTHMAVAIQVKTRTPAYRRAWRSQPREGEDDADFYVFVDLGNVSEQPRYWVVPAEIVSRVRRNDQVRNVDVDQFEGGWDQLDQRVQTSAAT